MRGPHGRFGSVWAALAVLLLSFALIPLGAVPVVHSVNPEPAYCIAIGGSWNGVSTCTNPGGVVLTSGAVYDVPSGTTLVIATTGGVCGCGIEWAGTWPPPTFNNHGTVNIDNTGANSIGIFGDFTFNNYGVMNIDNSGAASYGYENDYYFTNSGTINIANSDGFGLFNIFGGTPGLANTGTINVKNTGGTGLFNNQFSCQSGLCSDIFTNSGTINVCGGTTLGTIPTVGNPIVNSCPQALGVAEFPFGLALLFSMLVPALLALRKRNFPLRTLRV